jgi:AraC-like DNA-binding protein
VCWQATQVGDGRAALSSSRWDRSGRGSGTRWGRAGIELHERLIDAPTMAARFSILENFLLSRPWSSARRQPGVAAALAAIEDNPSIRMADIRDLVGMSTKRLVALFRAEVGLSPKAYARIRRFQAALRLLGTGTSGARVAAEVRYFDQAHFVREFRSFTGMTPTQGRGWRATVTDMAVPGNAWKRWEHPAIPADVPGAPRGYFAGAVKA